MEGTIGRGRLITRLFLTILYGGAGYVHLTKPEFFMPIMPEILPFPRWIVLITGMAEIWGAIGLWIPAFRKAAGIGLALYALCVWPANINHMILDLWGDGTGGDLGRLSPTYHIVRQFLQPVLIWAALWATHVIDWPFAKKDERV